MVGNEMAKPQVIAALKKKERKEERWKETGIADVARAVKERACLDDGTAWVGRLGKAGESWLGKAGR